MGLELHYFVEVKNWSGDWHRVLISCPDDHNCQDGFNYLYYRDRSWCWLLQGLWPQREWPTDVSAPIEEIRTMWKTQDDIVTESSTYVTLPELLEYVECKLFGKPVASQTWVTEEQFWARGHEASKILVGINEKLEFLTFVYRLVNLNISKDVRVLMFYE